MTGTGGAPPRPAPPYRVETERLLLRHWEPADAEPMLAVVEESREHLARWLGWARKPLDLEEERAKLRRARGQFDLDRAWRYGVFDRADGGVLGLVCTWEAHQPHVSEVGYWMAASAGGRGLATEAVGALVRVAVERLRFERVRICTDPADEPSLRLARHLGFRDEGTLRGDFRHADGKLVDSVILSLLASEYADAPAKDVALTAFDGLGREGAL